MYFQEVVMGQLDGSGSHGWQHDRVFHDPYLNSISLSHLATSSQTLLNSLQLDDRSNPYLRLMPTLYREAVGDELPDVLGVSVTAVNQVVPALALSHWMRSVRPSCKIVWGGQWVTHVLDRSQSLAALFDVVDGMVVGEGEVPLASILSCEIRQAGWDDVPNVFRRAGAEVVAPLRVVQSTHLNHLPTPDFAGIPLDRFDYPYTLPLQTSRGCFWKRCRFCSYVTLDPVYKCRDVEQVVDDIELLIARYPLQEVAFTDAVMEPERFVAISHEILRRGIHIRWRGFGRFDRRFFSQDFAAMADAGLRFIIWGMESGSDSVLRSMKKGTTSRIAQRNLEAAAAAGIHNRVCLIYGYPGETVKDRDRTIAFLRQNEAVIHSMAFSPLAIERGTPLACGREVARIEACPQEADLDLHVPQTTSALTLQYLRETEQEFRRLHLQLERRRTGATIGGHTSPHTLHTRPAPEVAMRE
jgi:radical SAM superfamily enzyme YgiQ (UPF0313 family)